LESADVFFGVSDKNILTESMLCTMAPNPIVFALANPDPEIDPKLAHKTRSDLIIATGRSDYPNQVNNVLGFPYIFRGALDVCARDINLPMQIAAVHALRKLAHSPAPAEVVASYGGETLEFGRHYILPKANDPRLIHAIPEAVSQAAITSGVAQLNLVKNG